MEEQAAEPKQSQHYIPRFLLENFSHPSQTSRGTAATPAASQGGARRRVQPVVNCVDMSSDTPSIVERPVDSVAVTVDMDQDARVPREEQNRIEQKLRRLESDASAVFRRVFTAFSANQQGLWLTREDRNLVRKFLLVTKYRGPIISACYRHETMATYVADDREQLAAYMRQRGFSRPVDVWLDNLDGLLDIRMDDEMAWIGDLQRRVYPPDASWAIAYCQASYMAICTPSAATAEFLVTENCYSVVEGPHRVLADADSGTPTYGTWESLHEFAPLSPRLLIVLRSFLFPCPEEDGADLCLRTMRQLHRSVFEVQFGRLSETMLADLPVSKARNNYSELVDGVLRPIRGMTGARLRRQHSFFFRFFPLETTHVDRINGIFLDSASACRSLVFCSEAAFRASLRWYLTDNTYFPKRPGGINAVAGGGLRKLFALLVRLGGDTSGLLEALRHVLDGDNASLPAKNVYRILGGSPETLLKDMDQAARMFTLRVKIDVWSQGIDERVRQRNRDALIEHFLAMPRRRLWLFLKCWKQAALQEGDGAVHADAPEDVVARAWRVVGPGRLNQLMYWATGNYILRTRPPGFNPWARVTLDEGGARQLAMLAEFAFSTRLAARSDALLRVPPMALWTEDQFVEMSTRMAVEPHFKGLLRGDLEEETLDAFAEVFFGLLYPLIPGVPLPDEGLC
ncbi:hypothetical protein E4U42_007080 [Claviceps africana]|uniref:Uncharacterized protein n=1 Tax=Claviceps africana TaxID=83212 RepID=A0A8K0NFC5_9HYPO|nr:hypothetical protein E4U42_007080 [Claviceps africana]